MTDALAVFAGALVFALWWAWAFRKPRGCPVCRVLGMKCGRHK